MSGRAMDGESQRGLKKMKPLSLAPLSLGGDQLEPGDAMIDAMIDKLLHFGADASASPVTPRAAGRFGLARAGGAAISQRDVAALLRAAKAAFLAEPMLLEIAAPVKLVGDIHGQYADLLRVFDECGGPGLRGNRRLGRGVPTKLQNSRARSNRSRFGRFVNESFSRRVLHGERRELRRNGRIRVEVMSKIWFWRRPRRRPLPLPRRLR